MKKLPDLEQLLQYKNPTIIERFKRNLPNQANHAEELFTEALKYLWLCKKHEQDRLNDPSNPALQFIPVMHEEMRPIDNMWHEFILVTIDYQNFCLAYFGEFLHHVPNMREKLQITEEEFAQQLGLFLNYVYDQLGEKTLISWFSEHIEASPLANEASSRGSL